MATLGYRTGDQELANRHRRCAGFGALADLAGYRGTEQTGGGWVVIWRIRSPAVCGRRTRFLQGGDCHRPGDRFGLLLKRGKGCYWTDYDLVSKFVGDGALIFSRDRRRAMLEENSKLPVLMFQGTYDRNVSNQSIALTRDAQRSWAKGSGQASAGPPGDGLDHYLEDNGSWAGEMLRKSDEFLRAAFAAGH